RHRGTSAAGDAVRAGHAVAAGVAEAANVSAPWAPIHAVAPQLATTMVAYVAQIRVSMRPSTARAIDTDLRIFAGFLIEHDPALGGVVDIERSHIEAFKVWQWGAARHVRPTEAGDVPPPHGPAAHLLPAHRRVGLGRRPHAGADLLRRRSQAR
ncbi:MAG TPA: hypothetical protein VK988_14825, partial [Acidimicrobiales bacterium]|nr:hypothetical protein [Acidimicrobiales bacterium]